MPMRLRRKLVRRSGGRASHVSNRALCMNSNCFLRLRRFCFFAGLNFGIHFFQRYQDSEIFWAARGAFAFDDVSQARDQEFLISEWNRCGAASQRFIGTNSAYADAEVYLQGVALAHQAEHL